MHEREGKVRWILLSPDIFQLGLLTGGEHGRLPQHVEQQSLLYPRLFTESKRFGKGLHPQAKQGIDHQLHRGPHAACAHIEAVCSQHVQEGFALLIGCVLPADEDHQAALFHLWHTSRDGSIDHRDAFLLRRLVETTRSVWRNRTQIDNHRATMHSGKRTVGTEHHVLLGLVIRHAGHHNLAASSQVFGRLDNQRSPLSYLLGLLLCTIIHGQLITSIKQPASHRNAHVPHADEANARFQMVAFCIHHNTSLSSEMLVHKRDRHPVFLHLNTHLLSKLFVIRQQICYHKRIKSEGSLESLTIAPDPLSKRGSAWSASHTDSILEGSREVSAHQIPCQFPSLPIHGCAPVGHAERSRRASSRGTPVILWPSRSWRRPSPSSSGRDRPVPRP